MLGLKDMLKTIKEYGDGVIKTNIKIPGYDPKADLFKTMLECHPFVFYPSGRAFKGPQHIDPALSEQKIDSPFPVFSIECHTLDDRLTPLTSSDIYREKMDVRFLICREMSPNVLRCYGTVDAETGKFIMIVDEDSKKFQSIINVYLNRIQTESCGVIEGRTHLGSFKVNNKKRKPVFSDRVFVVCPKERRTSIGHRDVQWTHRWSVRGHWMTLPNPESIGKDRNGVPCIKGKAWRVSHIKGPETAEFIKKQRIVKETRVT